MAKVAFVFPGQGSQSVGMLDGWGDHPVVAQTVAEASDALGEDVGLLIKQGPKEALALTTNTQPVMLVAGVAAWRVWQAEGGALPDAVAGHSLGEYSALVASGVLTLALAVVLLTGARDTRTATFDEIDVQRAREILDEIRRRLGNNPSADYERRYLERLLDLQ